MTSPDGSVEIDVKLICSGTFKYQTPGPRGKETAGPYAVIEDVKLHSFESSAGFAGQMQIESTANDVLFSKLKATKEVWYTQ